MHDNSNYEPAIEDSKTLHDLSEIMRLTLEDYNRALKRGDLAVVLSSMRSMRASSRMAISYAKHTVRFTKELS